MLVIRAIVIVQIVPNSFGAFPYDRLSSPEHILRWSGRLYGNQLKNTEHLGLCFWLSLSISLDMGRIPLNPYITGKLIKFSNEYITYICKIAIVSEKARVVSHPKFSFMKSQVTQISLSAISCYLTNFSKVCILIPCRWFLFARVNCLLSSVLEMVRFWVERQTKWSIK